VTQVVAADNAHVFHNRLTHSLQVAQVGQSIAEELIRSQGKLARDVIDPDVVEAACLAHDLGHPPFGHTAEDELKQLAEKVDLRDRFEGNAQSFRIVTKLAFRSLNSPGLNLTCATLSALLKYPWLKTGNGEKSRKWGAYDSEKLDFHWACKLLPAKSVRTAEAEVMDWSDDVTYAVHDVEDFYRAGRIPLHLLSTRKDDRERREFYDEVFRRRKGQGGIWKKYTREELESAFENIVVLFQIEQPYSGTQEHRAQLRKFSGQCINMFVRAITLRVHRPGERYVDIDPVCEKQVTMLKELTWHYVINAPELAARQHGQRKIISGLFESYLTAAEKKDWKMFPNYYQEKMRDSAEEIPRLVIDLIAGMTERQCVDVFRTLTGIAGSPGLD
jgi:dGTPase